MTIHAQFQAAIKSKSKSTAGNERLSKIMGTGCVRVASAGNFIRKLDEIHPETQQEFKVWMTTTLSHLSPFESVKDIFDGYIEPGFAYIDVA